MSEYKSPINDGSLRWFWKFMDEYELSRPMITVCPDGQIYCTWEDGRNLLSLVFMENGEIIYVHHNEFKKTWKSGKFSNYQDKEFLSMISTWGINYLVLKRN